MNQDELKQIVAELLQTMPAFPQQAAQTDAIPDIEEPAVKASDYRSGVPQPEHSVRADITAIDLRSQYLEESPQNPSAFLDLKRKTPARLGSGRAGTRYKTLTLLRFRADHAAAQDSVFSQVPDGFAAEHGLTLVQTTCQDKDEYLTRPDHGRCFDEAAAAVLRGQLTGKRIALLVGDGLSSAAIEANAIDCLSAIRAGLDAYGLPYSEPVFIRYCRVGAMDHIGDLCGCEAVCLLVGERPGLVTAESMSAYLAYRPHRGIAESMRTVVSNIHRQGTPPVEAGAHIAALLRAMLEQKASGINLKQEGIA